jgi:hypothetical protein
LFAAFQPGGAPPPSSTNRPLKSGQIKTTYRELVDASTPRAIKTEEVAVFCEQFRIAARNAIEAGKTHIVVNVIPVSPNIFVYQHYRPTTDLVRSILLCPCY